MNNTIKEDLERRLSAAKSLETHIAQLQIAKTKLKNISASGHAVDIAIKTTTVQTSVHASTSEVDVFTPTEVREALVTLRRIVATKLNALEKEYAAI